MIYSFGECELDDERFELRRHGSQVKLEPKVFDVLAYLVRHAERVVPKAELLDAVWADVVVSESVLPKCVAAARRAIGDTRAGARVIGTIHGRGYRLLAAVRSHAIAASCDAPPPPRTASGPDLAYVGRHGLRARLLHALDEASVGHGRLVVLLGEAGIGKTRTAEGLVQAARDRAIAVAIGRAHEGDGAPAFWPWVQLLRAVVTLPEMAAWLVAGGAIAPEVLALVPELGRRPPERRVAEGRDARFRLFDGVTRIFRRAAERGPLVLLLDDLHWADAGSLDLLALFASEVGTLPLLVLATCRDDEIDRTTPLADLMGTLARAPACDWIPLAGLDREETRALIGDLAATTPSPALLDTIHALTTGNPFFIHEITRLLVADGAAAIADVAAMTLSPPRRIRDATRRRLGTLSSDARTLLRAASVLGQDFDAATLAAVAELPRARVLSLLGEGRAAHLLDADPDLPSRYVFHHALIRHALYDELDDAERVRLHGRSGECLEARAGADLDSHLDAIAHHYFSAVGSGEVARTVEACVRAAERAECLYAYERAGRLYERALSVFEAPATGDETRRVELLLALGEARTAAGDREGGHDAFMCAATGARALGRADLLARAALGYRSPAEMGSPDDPTAIALLDDALAAVGGTSTELRARMLSRMAGMPSRAATMARRAELSREAYALAERSGDTMALRDALSARLWAALGPDHVDERLMLGRELLRFAERERSLPMTLLAHDATFGAQLLRGDMDAAARALAAYGETAAAMKQPAFLFLTTYWGGSMHLVRGELDAAERAFRAALALGRRTVPYAHFMYAGQMYPLLYLRGVDDDPELAGIFFGEMMALPYAFEPAVRSTLAFALWLRGEHAAAREEFEHVAAQADAGLERDEHWLITLGGLSRLAVLLGDTRRAAGFYDQLHPYADLVVVHDLLRAVSDPVAAILGHLCVALRRFDDGVQHYETALAKTSSMRARLAHIDAQVGYAQLLTARGGARDRTRAAALRREASAAMTALGVCRNWVLEAGC